MGYEITTTVDINASTARVWAVLVDFARYGEWSNFSHVEGRPVVGSRLRVRMPGFSFRPTVAAAEPNERLAWTGTLISTRVFHGRHSFVLSARPDGTTHVVNHEEFSGALVSLGQRFMPEGNDNGYTAFNAGLKQRAERLPQQPT